MFEMPSALLLIRVCTWIVKVGPGWENIYTQGQLECLVAPFRTGRMTCTHAYGQGMSW